MNTATHSVVVPFPQAFASPKRSPFPCAPRYGAIWLTREDNRSLDGYGAPFGIIRPSLSLVLWFFTLMLLPKGAIYFRTRKHESHDKPEYRFLMRDVAVPFD